MKQFTPGPQFLTLELASHAVYGDAEIKTWNATSDQPFLVVGIVLADTTEATRVFVVKNVGTMILRSNTPPRGDQSQSEGIAPSALARLPFGFAVQPGCKVEVQLRGPCSSGYLVVMPQLPRVDEVIELDRDEPGPPRRRRSGFAILGEW